MGKMVNHCVFHDNEISSVEYSFKSLKKVFESYKAAPSSY